MAPVPPQSATGQGEEILVMATNDPGGNTTRDQGEGFQREKDFEAPTCAIGTDVNTNRVPLTEHTQTEMAPTSTTTTNLCGRHAGQLVASETTETTPPPPDLVENEGPNNVMQDEKSITGAEEEKITSYQLVDEQTIHRTSLLSHPSAKAEPDEFATQHSSSLHSHQEVVAQDSDKDASPGDVSERADEVMQTTTTDDLIAKKLASQSQTGLSLGRRATVRESIDRRLFSSNSSPRGESTRWTTGATIVGSASPMAANTDRQSADDFSTQHSSSLHSHLEVAEDSDKDLSLGEVSTEMTTEVTQTMTTDELMTKKLASPSRTGPSPGRRATVRESIDRRLFSSNSSVTGRSSRWATGATAAGAAASPSSARLARNVSPTMSKGRKKVPGNLLLVPDPDVHTADTRIESDSNSEHTTDSRVERDRSSALLARNGSPTMTKGSKKVSGRLLLTPHSEHAADSTNENEREMVETESKSGLAANEMGHIKERGTDQPRLVGTVSQGSVSGAATVQSIDERIKQKRAGESVIGSVGREHEEEERIEADVGLIFLQRPGAYAVDEPPERVYPSSNASSQHLVHPPPDGDASPPPHRSEGVDGSSSEAFLIEATLVDDNDQDREVENDSDDGVAATAAVVARPLKFGINFGDRRIRLGLCLIVLAFVGLAVGLGLSLSGNGDSKGEETSMGVDSSLSNGDESSSSDVDESSTSTGVPTSEPTKSSLPSLSPTSGPSNVPSTAPTAAPTSWTWQEIGQFTGHIGGGFGSKVMLSADGTRVAVAYKNWRSMCHTRRSNRALRNTGTKRHLACGEDNTILRMYEQNVSSSEWTLMGDGFPGNTFELGKNSAVAFSGVGGHVAVVLSAGVGGVYDINWDEEERSYSFSMAFPIFVQITEDDNSLVQMDVALSHDGSIAAVANSGGNGTVEVTTHEEPCDLVPIMNITLCTEKKSNTRIFAGPGLSSFGRTLSLSSDGSIIACGASRGNTTVVQAYQQSQGGSPMIGWTPMGNEIEGKAHPSSTSLSADGYRIALGGSDLEVIPVKFFGNPRLGEGEARVLDYNTTTGTWTQVGDAIKTGTAGQNHVAVSLSGDGETLAVGAPSSNAGFSLGGVTRVYRFDGTSWVQVGTDIHGQAGDNAGASVSLTSDGRRVAVGAPGNRDAGTNAGAARVHEMTSMT